jgi:hypothetical protein
MAEKIEVGLYKYFLTMVRYSGREMEKPYNYLGNIHILRDFRRIKHSVQNMMLEFSIT